MKPIVIKVDFNSLDGNGFARFRKKNTQKIITLDINAMLNLSTDYEEIEFRQLFSDCFVHELLHFFEDYYDKNFNHKRIHIALKKAREMKSIEENK